MFTHNSDIMARLVVKNSILEENHKYSDVILPWCTYTDPEIGHVGYYPWEMDELGIEYDTYKSDFSHNDWAVCEQVNGFIKFHCKKGTDEILGCTVCGGPAGDMITHVTSAMFNKIGLSTIGAGVTPYPVYSEGIKACTGQITVRKFKDFSKNFIKKSDR